MSEQGKVPWSRHIFSVSHWTDRFDQHRENVLRLVSQHYAEMNAVRLLKT